MSGEAAKAELQKINEEHYIAVESLGLQETELTLTVGDNRLLTVSVLPADATKQNVLWVSTDDDVINVVDGRIEAKGAGEAQVYCVSQDNTQIMSICNATVCEPSMEYHINSITLRDSGELAEIPKGAFSATVSVTKQTESGDAVLMLASYDEAGQYLNAQPTVIENVPVGGTIEAVFSVDNSAETIASLKAFVIESFSSLRPAGAPISFSTQ